MSEKNKDQPAHELLAAMFDTIVEEAKRNDRFAEDLLSTLPKAGALLSQGQKPKAAPKPQRTAKPSDDFAPAAYNPINLYREFGEDLTRVKLQKLTCSNLNSLIRHFKLRQKLKLKGKSQTKQTLITALLTFAAEYDRQRKGAAG